MDTPQLCERVRIRGHKDKTYIIIKVDEESQTVDLMPASGSARGPNDVPFSELLRTIDAQQ